MPGKIDMMFIYTVGINVNIYRVWAGCDFISQGGMTVTEDVMTRLRRILGLAVLPDSHKVRNVRTGNLKDRWFLAFPPFLSAVDSNELNIQQATFNSNRFP